MGMPTRDHQGQHREFEVAASLLLTFEQHGMNVPFNMVYSYQGLVERKCQRLGETDSDEQCPYQSGTFRDGNCIDRLVRQLGLRQSLPCDGHNGAKVFTGCQLRHYSPIWLMSCDLRCHYVGKNVLSRAYHGGSRLVTRGLNAEDDCVRHNNFTEQIRSASVVPTNCKLLV